MSIAWPSRDATIFSHCWQRKGRAVVISQRELEARYAGEVYAQAARFMVAKHVPDALAKLGLIGPADHLVLYADDFQDAFIERFPRESLFFVAEPSVSAFEAAMGALPTGSGRAYWFVNAIGGRGLRVPDLRSLARAAHAVGAALIVDNTVPSLFGCCPLALGADLCLEALDRVAVGELSRKTVALAWRRVSCTTSDAKKTFLGGHKRSQFVFLASLVQGIDSTRLDDDDISVIDRGLSTLSARMQRHFDHARAIAEYLSCCDTISSVSYPGLASHPDHPVAANMLTHGYGPAVDFELPASVTAAAFIARCGLNGRGHPAGGPHTRMTARDGDDARFIRLFAGLDDPLAIADDLDQAMRWFCNPPEP